MADLKRTVNDQKAELEKLRALNQRDDNAAQQVDALQKEVRSKEALIAKLNAERTLAIADSGSLGTYTLGNVLETADPDVMTLRFPCTNDARP